MSKELEQLVSVWENELKPRITRQDQAIDAINDRLDGGDAMAQKAGLATPAVEGKGPLLGLEQKIAPHFTPAEGEPEVDFDPKAVRLGALLAGALHYDKCKSALSVEERKALSILVDPSGGMLLPTAIGSIWLDAVRPKLRVLQAGALSYPMEAHNVILPGWDQIPTAGWRGEGGQFQNSGGSFRLVDLNAKDVGCFIDIPGSLMEDGLTPSRLEAVSALIEAQLSKAVSQALDLAALLSQDALTTDGSNATVVPRGLAKLDSQSQLTSNYGINVSNVTGTNGATPSWDNIVDTVAAVRTANFEPTGHLSAPRTFASLAKSKAVTAGDYLIKPAYLNGVTEYDTTQAPITMKKGTSTDCSASFIGDFSQMVLGLRGEVNMLRDPYTQGLGRVTRLIIWVKADVGILNKGGFQIIDGVRG